ncbi:MAG: hypothetical protein ABFD50_06005 [Smithella sp.]
MSDNELTDLKEENSKLRSALQLVLSQVDYMNGRCRMAEIVGAVLPKEVLKIANDALKRDGNHESKNLD